MDDFIHEITGNEKEPNIHLHRKYFQEEGL